MFQIGQGLHNTRQKMAKNSQDKSLYCVKLSICLHQLVVACYGRYPNTLFQPPFIQVPLTSSLFSGPLLEKSCFFHDFIFNYIFPKSEKFHISHLFCYLKQGLSLIHIIITIKTHCVVIYTDLNG